jgi:biotin carboxyl carrier protein
MYFEAESNGQNYSLTIREDRECWRVGIKKETSDWNYYNISKKDYQKVDQTISFIFKNSSYLVDVIGEETDYTVYTRGSFRKINIFNDEMILHESLKSGGSISGGNNLTSGMPGKIVKVFVEEGQEIKEGEPLLIMEAMKMENEMRASGDVIVDSIHVVDGDTVESGAVLISFK